MHVFWRVARDSRQKHRFAGSRSEHFLLALKATALDPLRDINGLKRIDFVMKNGLVYRRP